MSVEILVVAGGAVVGLVPLLRGARRAGLLVVGLAAAATAGALWFQAERSAALAARRAEAARLVPGTRSEGGYVGSGACRSCHPSEHASWHRTHHRTMTTLPSPETVRADFGAGELRFHGRTYRVLRKGDGFFVEMPDPGGLWDRMGGFRPLSGEPEGVPRVEKRVVMVTGSHHQQVFWVPGALPNQLDYFPVVWVVEQERWVPMRDVFLRDPGLAEGMSLWNYTCIQCHSTGGRTLPSETSNALDTDAGELGIACEACHGPGAEHVRANQDPLRRYRQRAAGTPDPTIVNPEDLDHVRSSQVCGQCHGIAYIPDLAAWHATGSRYRPGQDLDDAKPLLRPTRIESQQYLDQLRGQDPHYVTNRWWSDGMVRVSGREFNGLVESPCYQRGELACISCHSMHKSDPDDQLAAGMRGDEACLQCHDDLRGRIAEHTHHDAPGSGSRCYDCHMPHTTYGLLKAIRSHEIDSPTVAATLATGRPNACNLCHADKTLAWTRDHLAEWYGQDRVPLDHERSTVSAVVLDLLRGDAGQRALAAWTLGWGPAREASGDRWMTPFLAQGLTDRYSAVRYIAARSLAGLRGAEHLDYDHMAPPEERARVQRAVIEAWTAAQAARPSRTGEAILVLPDGRIDLRAVRRLLEARDGRVLDLKE